MSNLQSTLVNSTMHYSIPQYYHLPRPDGQVPVFPLRGVVIGSCYINELWDELVNSSHSSFDKDLLMDELNVIYFAPKL